MISLADILRETSAQAGFRAQDLVGRTPHPDIYQARDRAVLLARRLRPDFSLPFLGRHLGGRDHTTILACERRATTRLSEDAVEAETVSAVLACLGLDELPEADETARYRGVLARELVIAEARVADLIAQLAALNEPPAAEAT